MSENIGSKIEAIYEQLKTLQAQPLKNILEDSTVVVDEANYLIGELSEITGNNYERYLMKKVSTPSKHREYYPPDSRSKLRSLVAKLKIENGFDKPVEKSPEAPVIVQVNQSQQVSLTVTPIVELIDRAGDDETRQLLVELKEAVEKKDEKKVSGLLKTVADKSFELLIRVLPYLLEQWSNK